MDREQLLGALEIFAKNWLAHDGGLDDFPCSSVGIVEFSTFARTIDPAIRTRCLHCPPDAPEGKYCAWEFTVGDDDAEEPPR
jgi:hypothetical protein